MTKIALLIFIAICVFLIMFAIANMIRVAKSNKHLDDAINDNSNEINKQKGIVGTLNYSDLVKRIGEMTPNSEIEIMFNRSKNPWNMTVATFQFIRFGGLTIFGVISILLMIFGLFEVGILMLCIGVLCFIYPKYYYKAIGNEREAEWNKMYEFIWVIKHNVMLYDPAKAFMNTKIYIQEHAPHNQEIINGFDDFYKYWNPDHIDPYIEKYYSFSVPREIFQIIFNMNKTGDFPEEQLNALRKFVINAQDLTVEKKLSSVSGKATIFSLPFMMVSVIVALMIPLIIQVIQLF